MDHQLPLELQRSMIALESRHPMSALKAVAQRLPAFIKDIAAHVKRALGNVSNVAGLLDTSSRTRKLLDTRHYGQLKELGVFIPPGLRVTYLDYVLVLEEAQGICDDLLPKVLLPFDQWLAVGLTQPNTLNTARVPKTVPGVFLHDLDAMSKKIANCFTRNSTQSTTTFGAVAKRVSDYHLAIDKARSLQERQSKISVGELNRVTEEILDKLDRLIINTQQYPERYRLSGPMLDLLSHTSYAVAKELEFFSVYSYQLAAFLTALKDTEQRLFNILNR